MGEQVTKLFSYLEGLTDADCKKNVHKSQQVYKKKQETVFTFNCMLITYWANIAPKWRNNIQLKKTKIIYYISQILQALW